MRLWLCLLLFTACARPNYQTPAPKPGFIRFDRTGWTAAIRWVQLPTDQNPGEMIAQFSRTEDKAKPPQVVSPGYSLNVYLWMDSMGHGSSKITSTESKVTPGVFDIKNVFFMMHGVWKVHFQLMRDQTVVDEVIYSLHY